MLTSARRTRRTAAAVLAAALVAGPLLVGCASATTVPYTQDEVTVPVGGTLVVDFGTVNASIGDGWRLSTPPDPAVLGDGDERWAPQGEGDGAPADLTWTFEALAPGTTTLGFTYAYRGEDGDPEGRTADPAPVLTVTVTG